MVQRITNMGVCLTLGIIAIVILGLAVAGGISIWQSIGSTPEQASLRIEFAKLGAQVGLAIVVMGTLYVAWRRAKAAEDTVKVAQEGQVTERFTRAIEQISGDSLAIRLGGIYALERIAKDSHRDHWQVMEVLTAYVQETTLNYAHKLPPTRLIDIQAILIVLGRRNAYQETAG